MIIRKKGKRKEREGRKEGMPSLPSSATRQMSCIIGGENGHNLSILMRKERGGRGEREDIIGMKRAKRR